MTTDFLVAKQAAQRLGMSVGQLYEWLRLSNGGELVIGGQATTIEYFQGGPKGQGRIRISVAEVERLIELTRVRPQAGQTRRLPIRRAVYPGITVALGRPESR
jgi:hypothetical protein